MILIIFPCSLIVLRIYTYNNLAASAALIDHFNPMVSKERVYTRIKNEFVQKYPDSVTKIDNFVYTQTAYTAHAKKRKLEYVSFEEPLKDKQLLELTVKGQSVESWKEIGEEELPKEIKKLLK